MHRVALRDAHLATSTAVERSRALEIAAQEAAIAALHAERDAADARRSEEIVQNDKLSESRVACARFQAKSECQLDGHAKQLALAEAIGRRERDLAEGQRSAAFEMLRLEREQQERRDKERAQAS